MVYCQVLCSGMAAVRISIIECESCFLAGFAAHRESLHDFPRLRLRESGRQSIRGFAWYFLL